MEQNQSVSDFFNTLKDRAIQSYERGNKTGATYLANIAGMWSHVLHRPIELNIFEGLNADLYREFRQGYWTSEDAVKMNAELSERYRKFEEERLKTPKKDTKKDVKKQTGSIWTRKLW